MMERTQQQLKSFALRYDKGLFQPALTLMVNRADSSCLFYISGVSIVLGI